VGRRRALKHHRGGNQVRRHIGHDSRIMEGKGCNQTGLQRSAKPIGPYRQHNMAFGTSGVLNSALEKEASNHDGMNMRIRTVRRCRSWRNARARRRPLSVGSRRGGKPNSCSSFRHTRKNRRMNPEAKRKLWPGLRPTGYREHSVAKRNGACHPWWPGLLSNRENPHRTPNHSANRDLNIGCMTRGRSQK
jgi:hypothetical protein